MTDDRYDKVIFRGKTVDKYTRQALQAVEKELGYELTLWQGSYHKGVSKSAGTHDGGGVVDLVGSYDATRKVHAIRDNGFVGDLRTAAQGLSGEIHIVQIGNAKLSSSAKAQVYPMSHGDAGLARHQPLVIKYTPPGGYKAWVYKVEPVYTKPKSAGDIFTVGSYNLALYNKRGQSTYLARRTAVVQNVKSANLDVLCVQEAGYDQLKWWDAEFALLGLVRAKGGSDGRYIYYRESVFTAGKSGVFELYPEYQKDDKQAAWVVLNYNGTDFFFSSFHLESAEGAVPDRYRPKQMESLVSQADRVCDPLDIPTNRRIHAGDTNSTKAVKDQMWKAHRVVSASKNAWKITNGSFATFTNWLAKIKGDPVDYIFVDHTRPVSTWKQTLSSASDHNLIYATIGKR